MIKELLKYLDSIEPQNLDRHDPRDTLWEQGYGEAIKKIREWAKKDEAICCPCKAEGKDRSYCECNCHPPKP